MYKGLKGSLNDVKPSEVLHLGTRVAELVTGLCFSIFFGVMRFQDEAFSPASPQRGLSIFFLIFYSVDLKKISENSFNDQHEKDVFAWPGFVAGGKTHLWLLRSHDQGSDVVFDNKRFYAPDFYTFVNVAQCPLSQNGLHLERCT